MSNKLSNVVLAIAAVASSLLASASSSSASMIIDYYSQNVGQHGYDPNAQSYNSSVSTGPLGTSSASGYADITNSHVTATSINYTYAIGITVSTYGEAYAQQLANFHVDADTQYTFNVSSYAFTGYDSVNFGDLYSFSTGEFLFHDYSTTGAGFTNSGVLHPGIEYQFLTYAEPAAYNQYSPTQFEMTGSGAFSTAVPEPSSFVLISLGGIGLAVGAYRRQRFAADSRKCARKAIRWHMRSLNCCACRF